MRCSCCYSLRFVVVDMIDVVLLMTWYSCCGRRDIMLVIETKILNYRTFCEGLKLQEHRKVINQLFSREN